MFSRQEHPQRENYWGHVNPIGSRACYVEGKRVTETMTWVGLVDYLGGMSPKYSILCIYSLQRMPYFIWMENDVSLYEYLPFYLYFLLDTRTLSRDILRYARNSCAYNVCIFFSLSFSFCSILILCISGTSNVTWQVRVARIFNTYGPRTYENDGRVMSTFISQVSEWVSRWVGEWVSRWVREWISVRIKRRSKQIN